MTPRRPPWYAFLYRVLGAHGTFWLWVVTVATLWWTWEGAVLSMLNRYPERRSVSDAAHARDLKRWVILPGVRIVLDGQLLLKEDASDFQGTEILADLDDPAARFWRTTRTIADADAGAQDERLRKTAIACSEVAFAGLRVGKLEARRNLGTRLLMLQKNLADELPRGDGAILLLTDGGAASIASAPIELGGGDTESYDRLLRVWRDSVRRNVQVVAPRGLLVTAPGTVVERVAQAPGIPLGTNALRVDRSPRDLELYAFCAAATIVLFLATGLYGVVSTKEASSP
jgi:hypothetical protein